MIPVEEEIKKLKAELEKLKFEFNQYFAGNRKLPPYKERGEFERKLKELSRRKFFAHGPRFMVETLLASYTSYSSLWEKIMRDIEEGKYVRGKGWVGKTELKEPVMEPHKKEVKDLTTQPPEDSITKIYQEFRELKEITEGVPPSIDERKFRQQIEDLRKRLKMEKGYKEVDFRVVVENGKVKIKAIPVKEVK